MKEKRSDFEIVDRHLVAYSGIENHVIIPNNVKIIDENAFNSCEFLIKVTFCDSLEEIGESAFANCPNLNELEFANDGSLRVIGEEAFASCGFESLALPNTVKEIGNEAFYGNKKLTKIFLPKSLEKIGVSAFQHCEALISAYVSQNVTVIKRLAFADCDKLTVKTDLASRPEKWENDWNGNGETNCQVLWNCSEEFSQISRANCENGSALNTEKAFNISTKEYEVINGELIKVRSKQEEFVIPEGVTSIGWSVFKGNAKLKKVTVPKTAVTVKNYAFANCESLKTVVFAEGSELTEIGKNAFLNCKKLRWLLWDDNVRIKKIDDQAFCNCVSLCNLCFPNTLKHIGKFAFYNTSMTSVTVNRNIDHIGECAFCSAKTKNVAIDENAFLLDEYVVDKTKTKRIPPHSSPLKIRALFKKEETPNWDLFWHGGSDVFWNFDTEFRYEVASVYDSSIAINGINTNLNMFNGGNLVIGKRVFKKADIEHVKTARAQLFKKGRVCITLRKKSSKRSEWESLRKGKTLRGTHYDEIVFFDKTQNAALDSLVSAFKQNGIAVENDETQKRKKSTP